MFNQLGNKFKQAFKYLASNKIMSFASIGVLASCLLIIGSLYMVSINIQENIKTVEDKNEIALFIDDDATKEDIDSLSQTLADNSNVKSFEYKSKEMALEEYMQQFEQESALFEDLAANNPLPQYFSVVLKDINNFDSSIEQFKALPGVYKVRSQEQLVDSLLSIGKAVKYVSVSVMTLMLLASLFIIINTIRLASFAFRKQINIMKFVGATNWYVRWPFIMQGAMIGILAAIIAYLLQWYAYDKIFISLSKQIQFITVIPFEALRRDVLNIFMLSGFSLGILGSGLSIGKYLKV